MHKMSRIVGGALIFMSLTACTTHYKLSSIDRTRIVVDSRYDATPNQDAANFIAPYKHVVDSIMGPVVGHVAHDMSVERPESDLSNLLSDILLWAGRDYHEQPVVAVYNMGGIRAALRKGEVTFGDVLDVAPFENKICFLTLTGEKLNELFKQIAHRGGEGISHGVEMTITPKGELTSVLLNGKEIDPKADYRIATIDYLAQGNDGMNVLKEGTNLNSPQEESNNTRYIIMKFFKEMDSKGKAVESKIEGRIKIAN